MTSLQKHSVYLLLLCVLSLAAAGLLMLASTGAYATDGTAEGMGALKRQCAYVIIGVIAASAISLLDYRHWERFFPWIFGGTVVVAGALLRARCRQGNQRREPLGRFPRRRPGRHPPPAVGTRQAVGPALHGLVVCPRPAARRRVHERLCHAMGRAGRHHRADCLRARPRHRRPARRRLPARHVRRRRAARLPRPDRRPPVPPPSSPPSASSPNASTAGWPSSTSRPTATAKASSNGAPRLPSAPAASPAAASAMASRKCSTCPTPTPISSSR